MRKRVAWGTVLPGLAVFLSAWSAAAADLATTPKDFIVEPPTLLSLGFEWKIDGDSNRTAHVEVAYRKRGDKEWRVGLPLLRLDGEQLKFAPLDYTAPNEFAGSILNLEPATDYECRFTLVDPDGVNGPAEKLVTVKTRAEPMPAPGGNIYHVYPPGFTGTKQQPAFTGLLAAYYTGSSHSDWANAFPVRVRPGDTILVHAGVYQDDRFHYGGLKPGEPAPGTPFDGTYYLTASGTPDKPIVIKAAGDGEVVFDGGGAQNLFNLLAGNYNYFEGITIRNTNVAFLLGWKNIAGSSGFTLKHSRLENVGRGVEADWSGSKNFYIADNVFIGRHDPNRLVGWFGPIWTNTPGYPAPITSEYAVKVYGQGHVVAYNAVSNFHDGIDNATYGNPDGTPNEIADRLPASVDFYNNDIRNSADNCIEADGAARNIRVFQNRCFNGGERALSAQPIFGGPAYYFRNIVYNVPQGGSFKFHGNPAGVLVYQNTLIGELGYMMPASNTHFLNNLVLAQGALPEAFSVGTFTNYTSSDYNGFRPNPNGASNFAWDSPAFDVVADYTSKLVKRSFRTLDEYRQATKQDQHSILVDYDVFKNVTLPDKNDITRLYDPAAFDFSLRDGSPAIDAGTVIPTITDGFTGTAPDLGALEVGQKPPHYGPR